MIKIREFTKDDIPQVADVHREAMETGPEMTPALLDEYQDWLSGFFLESPMWTSARESLVCEDQHGEVVAFMGVLARKVLLDGKEYSASVGSNFCARPSYRGALGLRVAREYLARTGELAIVDMLTDRTRQLWDFMGMLPMPQSVRWTLPLRPARHAISVLGDRVPARVAATAVGAVFDALALHTPRSPFRHTDPELLGEELTGSGLAKLLMEFGTPQHLRPLTTDGSTAWLVERARSMKQYGDLQLIALRDAAGNVAGWYIYYAKHGAPGQVMQLVSTPAAAPRVLSHLALHALARGAVSLTGTMDPVFLSALSSHWAVITPAPIKTRWVMVHSTRDELLEAYWRSRVLLSRLDGEWCHQFR